MNSSEVAISFVLNPLLINVLIADSILLARSILQGELNQQLKHLSTKGLEQKILLLQKNS